MEPRGKALIADRDSLTQLENYKQIQFPPPHSIVQF